ncbi:MAG: transporter substrate-binding domain-containing protein [Bacteriovorax sp.]|nr:transporter substrate-binding domain-containing protein [Bacteriovorax sp.]
MKIVFLMLLFSSTLLADTIVLEADNWCPYNCDPADKNPGYMVEVAKHVFEKAGHKIEYKTVSWNRALQDAENGDVAGVIGASIFDLSNGHRSTEIIGQNNECFFVKAGSDFVYKTVDQLKGKKIGTVGGYTYTDVVNEYMKKNSQSFDPVQGDKAVTTNMKKLLAGRVDVVIENEHVFKYTAAKEKSDAEFKNAGCNPPDALYIAFSFKNPKSKEYAKILNDGMIALRKSGELKTILDKYGIKDWK